MADHHITLNIDLRAMTGRTQSLLRHAMTLVAIGLHSRQGISPDTLSIPDLTIQHHFDAGNQWTVEEAQEAWETWILRNGFRDVSEAISGVLEEAQQTLSLWEIVLIGEKRSLLGEDWNTKYIHRSRQFHRRTLPQKLDFLKTTYDFELNDSLVRQALSINAARNCLVHRSGVVAEIDTDSSGMLVVEWSNLTLVEMLDGEHREITLPHCVEADTQLGITTRKRSRSFEVGQLFHVNSEEFSQICWTLFQLTVSCTKSLELWGKTHGIEFKEA